MKSNRPDMRTIDRDLIVMYIENWTYPLNWVRWWAELDTPSARKNLHEVLFDGDELRDQTQPSVRRNVIACVLRDPKLAAMVWKECNEFMRDLADHLRKQRSRAPNPRRRSRA